MLNRTAEKNRRLKLASDLSASGVKFPRVFDPTEWLSGPKPKYIHVPVYPMDSYAATAERIRTLEAENAALRRQLKGNPEPAVEWCEYEPQRLPRV